MGTVQGPVEIPPTCSAQRPRGGKPGRGTTCSATSRVRVSCTGAEHAMDKNTYVHV